MESKWPLLRSGRFAFGNKNPAAEEYTRVQLFGLGEEGKIVVSVTNRTVAIKLASSVSTDQSSYRSSCLTNEDGSHWDI
jgi:hypothetical protein